MKEFLNRLTLNLLKLIVLALAYFLISASFGEVEFTLLKFTAVLNSTLIGTALAVIFIQLLGKKIRHFYKLICLLLAVSCSVLIVATGLNEYRLIDHLAVYIAFLAIVLSREPNSLTKQKQTNQKQSQP